MFKFLKQNKQEPVSERAQIKAMFQAMNKDPKIRAVYDVLRLPAVRNGFSTELVDFMTRHGHKYIATLHYKSPRVEPGFRDIFYFHNQGPMLRLCDSDNEVIISLSAENPATRLLRLRIEQAKAIAQKHELEADVQALKAMRSTIIERSRGSR
ncbi:hypothetical protein HDR63_01540 [bacterium]|nr:hypothetical protein [bacterium]